MPIMQQTTWPRLKQVLVACALLASSNASAVEDDKKKHFWVSGAISSAAYLTARHVGYSRGKAYLAAVGTSLAIGMAKEAFDAMDGNPLTEFDMHDIAYNAAGALVVPIVVVAF
jgi:uncharacterized protein YfiM (DUF2279 family)